MKTIGELLAETAALHRHLCPRQVLGSAQEQRVCYRLASKQIEEILRAAGVLSPELPIHYSL